MTHLTDPPPEAEASRLVQAADGSRWRTAGHTSTGEQLYVLEGVDVATCPMWVREREALLVDLTGGPLTDVLEEDAA